MSKKRGYRATIMGRFTGILTIIKKLYPDKDAEAALYDLYQEQGCNAAAVARYLQNKHQVELSHSGLWRQIERIKKDRLINGINQLINDANGNGGEHVS